MDVQASGGSRHRRTRSRLLAAAVVALALGGCWFPPDGGDPPDPVPVLTVTTASQAGTFSCSNVGSAYTCVGQVVATVTNSGDAMTVPGVAVTATVDVAGGTATRIPETGDCSPTTSLAGGGTCVARFTVSSVRNATPALGSTGFAMAGTITATASEGSDAEVFTVRGDPLTLNVTLGGFNCGVNPCLTTSIVQVSNPSAPANGPVVVHVLSPYSWTLTPSPCTTLPCNVVQAIAGGTPSSPPTGTISFVANTADFSRFGAATANIP